MASGSTWTRARSQATFFRQFSRHLFGIATWVPLAIWFNTSVAEVTMINGPSMYPFLNDNYNESLSRDLVLNYKLYAQHQLARGMVVSLRSPLHPDVVSVKRIIGLEGDIVHTRKPFPNSYVKVPPGHIWVEGDGGEGKSLDSNDYGPISAGLVVGHITHILYPFRKAGRVRWWDYSGRVGSQH